ncbi:hypothetical protein KGF86_04055 [Ornithinibacillus massiliensis]|uniref:Uncharacterized protein n=1 Tax=Ornithinibacillus massiliensis TaxID=1944633 RepID=A0ABS5MB62_9BACI|nr:hypothetical protein [Ornithinibacillus massiliensis]MBS3679385.1 hypothetical protein [Ornithinibacillus massiliensis]
MRKYLGIVSILVFLIAYWIYKSFIYGTETGAMPLLVIAYIISIVFWWFSDRGIWKTLAAVVLVLIPVAFILFAIGLMFGNFGT